MVKTSKPRTTTLTHDITILEASRGRGCLCALFVRSLPSGKRADLVVREAANNLGVARDSRRW